MTTQSSNNINQNDMILDPSEFNFFDLEDIKDIGINGGMVPDTSMGKQYDRGDVKDIFEDEDYDEAYDHDTLPPEEDDEVADLRSKVDEDESEFASASEFFRTASDEDEFDFGDFKVTKADLRYMANSREHIAENDNFLKAHAEKFSEGNDTIRGILQRNYTETQITIKAIEDRLKDDRISNTERGELYQNLEKQKLRQARIEQDYSEADKVRKEQESRVLNYRIRETDLAMQKSLGKDWDLQATFQYALKSGMAPKEVESSVSPALAAILTKARKFDEIEAQRNSKLKETIARSARSTSSNSASRKDDGAAKTVARKRMQDKWNKGEVNERDVSNSFNFLED